MPVRLSTDGGPQFASSTFRSFVQRRVINHVISFPGYPCSNGQAEANVKKVKYLIAKVVTTGDGDDETFGRGLMELHNIPSPGDRSHT